MVTTAVVAVTWLACLVTLLGFLGRWGWFCDLASHFRLQYAWGLAACAAWLLFIGQGGHALLALLGAAVNLSAITPLYAKTARPPSRHVFRALSANLWYLNRSHERVRQFIREANADILMFEEANDAWLAALKDLQADYPYSKSVFLRKGFGLLFCTRMPVESIEVVHTGEAGLPSLMARVKLRGQELIVIGAHPASPGTPRRARQRNAQLRGLASLIASLKAPVMLLGDLNITSWAPGFQDLVRESGLRDSRIGFGLQPTWPAHVAWLRVPIDHCLVSREIVVHRRRVGPNIGSDHYPVIVDFSITAA